MIMPPTEPIIKIGAKALVINPAGKLSNAPNRSPIVQPGQPGTVTQPITNPMPKRLMKAASSAMDLSGNAIGNIIATETAPKITPLITPTNTFDMMMSI